MALPKFPVTGNLRDILPTPSGGEIPTPAWVDAYVVLVDNIESGVLVWDGKIHDRPRPVKATVDPTTGEIEVADGPVLLLDNDPGLNVEGIQYRCDIKTSTSNTIASFWFDAPGDGSTVDLADVVSVPGVAAQWITKGDKGDDGDKGDPGPIGPGTSGAAVAAAATGVAATDTAAIQSLIDTASAAGGGRVNLRAGQTYVVTGLVAKSNVTLALQGATIKLANATTASVIATENYATLIGGDTTGGVTNFHLVGPGTLDGNKANQTGAPSTFPPVLAMYSYNCSVRGGAGRIVICNGYGTGFDSQWSTNSAFISPQGFMGYISDITIQTCKYDGLNFRGPHDAFINGLLIEKCSEEAGAVPLRLPDASGRANGTNISQVHIYGGGGYNYGCLIHTAGMQLSNIISEGAQIGQFMLWAGQVQLLDFHAYTGGIQTANAKGIVFGDASHTGINGCIVRGRVENCGGGWGDVTYMGWNNDVDVQHFYTASVTPTLTSLGAVGTIPPRNNIRVHTTDSGTGSGNTFMPTAATLNHQLGPQRTYRTSSSDTRNLTELRDETGVALFKMDWRGRQVACATGPTPTVAAGAGAGTVPTVAIVGDDNGGYVTVTVGTSPAAGTLATVTFSGAFGNLPSVVLTPGDAASAVGGLYATRTTTAFNIRCVGVPEAGDVYTIHYAVRGGLA